MRPIQKYPQLLIRKIEEYRLWGYDTGGSITAGGRQQAPGLPCEPRKFECRGTTASAQSPAGTATTPAQPPAAQPQLQHSLRPAQPQLSTVPAAQRDLCTAFSQTADNAGSQPYGTHCCVTEAEEPIKVVSLSTGVKTMENNNVDYVIVQGRYL
jgi:hypothetical protein